MRERSQRFNSKLTDKSGVHSMLTEVCKMSNRPAVLPVECKSISACRCNGINKYARSSAPPNRLMLFPRFLISKEPFTRHNQTVCSLFQARARLCRQNCQSLCEGMLELKQHRDPCGNHSVRPPLHVVSLPSPGHFSAVKHSTTALMEACVGKCIRRAWSLRQPVFLSILYFVLIAEHDTQHKETN
jgi:hypothetical protein